MSDTMTQKQKVKTMILHGPRDAVCGTTLLGAHIPRYAARIYELRQDGWPIQKRQCTDPGHAHASTQFEYFVEVPE